PCDRTCWPFTASVRRLRPPARTTRSTGTRWRRTSTHCAGNTDTRYNRARGTPMVSTSTRRSAPSALAAALFMLLAAASAVTRAQNRATALTSPKMQFGHDIGDDYFLVNYTQYVEYLSKLDRESDRMTVVDIGKTAEGRTEYTAIITSPENHRRLAQIKET